jgi:hypothetical protein
MVSTLHWNCLAMMSLNALLEEAAAQPFQAHTTCLNTDQFVTIRAPSSGGFRARLDAAVFGDADLIEAHTANLKAGLEVIEPVQWGTRGGRWSLRNISRSGEPFPAGELAYDSLTEAVVAAIEWWQTEPSCRGVLVRKADLKAAPPVEPAGQPVAADAQPAAG